MTTPIENLLEEVKNAVSCDEIGGDVLPLPPNSLPDRSSLVVNCFFEPQSLTSGGKQLLDRCRGDVSKILEVIATFIKNQGIEFDIVGISLFRMNKSGENVRVYWANSRKDILLAEDRMVVSEGSHVDEISVLL
ncbi:MAG: hypothetical protein JNL67_20575 [Planctomycetaceae bacterium]|nr:hypothetical protein [Planctomycetaceae bacterium]